MRVKTESRRQAIVQAAAHVFLEKGYAGTKMSDIAQTVGYSKATLYGYFESKEDLFLVTVQTLADAQFNTPFSQLDPAGPTRDTLQAFAEAMLSVTTSDDALALFRLVVAGSVDRQVAQRMFEQGPRLADRAVVEFLNLAIERGELKRCDTTMAADHLRGLLESQFFHKRLFGVIQVPSPQEISEAAKRALGVFWAAYGAPGHEG